MNKDGVTFCAFVYSLKNFVLGLFLLPYTVHALPDCFLHNAKRDRARACYQKKVIFKGESRIMDVRSLKTQHIPPVEAHSMLKDHEAVTLFVTRTHMSF